MGGWRDAVGSEVSAVERAFGLDDGFVWISARKAMRADGKEPCLAVIPSSYLSSALDPQTIMLQPPAARTGKRQLVESIGTRP